MGIKQLPPKSGEYLFEIVMRRCELRSTMMTSNRPLEEWGKLIGDVPAATAILDRFLHHANLIKIKGKSRVCFFVSRHIINALFGANPGFLPVFASFFDHKELAIKGLRPWDRLQLSVKPHTAGAALVSDQELGRMAHAPESRAVQRSDQK